MVNCRGEDGQVAGVLHPDTRKASHLARKPAREPQPRSMTPMWLEEWLTDGQIMLSGCGHFMVPSTDVARLCFAAAADLWFHAYRARDSTLLQLFEKSRSYDTAISENSYNLVIADRTQVFVFSIMEVLHSWREDTRPDNPSDRILST
jgi:hypothetical protein